MPHAESPSLDAGDSGNELRFVNDYRGVAACANAEFQQATIRSMPAQMLVVTRLVRTGEELLVDYGEDYWRGLAGFVPPPLRPPSPPVAARPAAPAAAATADAASSSSDDDSEAAVSAAFMRLGGVDDDDDGAAGCLPDGTGDGDTDRFDCTSPFEAAA